MLEQQEDLASLSPAVSKRVASEFTMSETDQHPADHAEVKG